MNLGTALNSKGRLREAVESYECAIAIDPDYAAAHYNLGTALLGGSDPARVEQLFRTTLRLREAFPDAWVGLALALEAQGKFDEAIDSYREAIRFKPDFAEAYKNLAMLCKDRGKIQTAVESYRQAMLLGPADAGVCAGLGDSLREQGEIDAALEMYRAAFDVEPDLIGIHSHLLFTLNYHPDKSAQEVFAAYRIYDERVGMPLRSTWSEHSNSRDPNKRLKVGYVSPDFRQHAVRNFLEPLFAHHDKRQVEVFAYAELSQEDAVTARYRGCVDHWVATTGLSDEALAQRIRADGIDILLDLAGHTADNRLAVFARKPAPVSISWLGFGYTTGLSAIDYMLTDGASAPEGSEGLFAEQPWRLATPGYAYRPAEGMGAVNSLPALGNGHVTFGTLTRSVRINHRSVRVWSQILHRVPRARLVVDSGNYRDAQLRSALVDKFAAHDINPERLEIGFHSPPWDVLRGMDIGLDCFPHNSGTTLFESLYMGVPFVTLAGRPSVGRLGSSILTGAGHPEWIARSEDEYVDLAVALASDLPKLATLRAGLRAEMLTSALMDEPGFARKVELAYRAMFARWAAGPGSAN